MKREIREKRDELRKTGKRLREMAWNLDFNDEARFKIREKQDKEYKLFKFYDGMIKASDKVRSNNEI